MRVPTEGAFCCSGDCFLFLAYAWVFSLLHTCFSRVGFQPTSLVALFCWKLYTFVAKATGLCVPHFVEDAVVGQPRVALTFRRRMGVVGYVRVGGHPPPFSFSQLRVLLAGADHGLFYH